MNSTGHEELGLTGDAPIDGGNTFQHTEVNRVKQMLEAYLMHLGYNGDQVNAKDKEVTLSGRHPLTSAKKRDLVIAALQKLDDKDYVGANLKSNQMVGGFILRLLAIESGIEAEKTEKPGAGMPSERAGLFASTRKIEGTYQAGGYISAYKELLTPPSENPNILMQGFDLSAHPNPRTSTWNIRGSHFYYLATEALKEVYPYYFQAQEIRKQLDTLIIPGNEKPFNVLRRRAVMALNKMLADYDKQTPERYATILTQAIAVFKIVECYATIDASSTETLRQQAGITGFDTKPHMQAIEKQLLTDEGSSELNLEVTDETLQDILSGEDAYKVDLKHADRLVNRSAYNHMERILWQALEKAQVPFAINEAARSYDAQSQTEASETPGTPAL